jgi:hypothetical protein
VILVVAVRDLRIAMGCGIGAVKGDGGRVVVEPAGVELKLLDDPQGEAKPDAAAPFGGERVQGARDPIVVDRRGLRGRQPHDGRLDGREPGGDAIQRAGGDEQIVHQHGQRACVIDDPLAGAADAAADDALEHQTLKEVGDDRVGAEVVGPVHRARRGGAGGTTGTGPERHPSRSRRSP